MRAGGRDSRPGSADETSAAGTGLAAEIRLDRWDPSRQAWLPLSDAAAAELPSGQEGDHGHSRLRAAGAVVAAIFDGLGSADF
jgi:hypothetical protein